MSRARQFGRAAVVIVKHRPTGLWAVSPRGSMPHMVGSWKAAIVIANLLLSHGVDT